MGVRTRECSLRDLHPELHSALTRHIPSEEEILLCLESEIRAKSILTGGDKDEHIDAQAITDRRVICASLSVGGTYVPKSYRGKVGTQSMYLSDIAHIGEDRDPIFQLLCVELRGHAGNLAMTLYFESKAAVDRFVGILLRAVDEARQATRRSPSAVANRLRELTALYQEGLLTDNEFQQKRKALLDQL